MDQDINPTPEDGIPNQDILPNRERGQTPETSDQAPIEIPDESSEEILTRLDDATESLIQAATDDATPAPEVVDAPNIPTPEANAADDSLPAPKVDIADFDLGDNADAGPDLNDLDASTKSLDQFGEKLNSFDDAGGADAAFDFGGGGDSGDNKDAVQQVLDSDYGNRSQVSETLIDHARRVDELTTAIERERL